MARLFKKLIDLILVTLCAGCSREGNNATTASNAEKPKILVGRVEGDPSSLPDGMVLHEGRDPTAPARVSRQPVVVDDAKEIQRTSQLFEKRTDQLYQQTLTQIRHGELVFSEHHDALKQHRDKAIGDLGMMVANTTLSAVARARAAETLVVLGDATGEQFLFEALQSASAEMRLAAAESLDEWNIRADFTQPDRIQRLLHLLDDENEQVVRVAARLCTHRSIPGTEEKLIAVLDSRNFKDAAAIARELADVATTPRAVDTLLRHTLPVSEKEFKQWTGYAFHKLLQHPDKNISEPVRKALHAYTLRFEQQRYDQSLVEYLAQTADHASMPILEDIMRNARDSVSRTYAVEGLARLQPEKAVELLLDHIQQQGPRGDIVRRLRVYATGADYDRIAPAILTSLEKTGKSFNTETAQLFLIELGENGRKTVESQMERLDNQARMWFTWKLRGLDLRMALNDCEAAGIIRTLPDVLINKMNSSAKLTSMEIVGQWTFPILRL